MIGVDGTGRVDTTIGVSGISYEGIWWTSGTIPAAAQLTLAPGPIEVWPGFARQSMPALLDGGGNLIL